MADMNIFQDEAFSVPNLTFTINDMEPVPSRLGSMGLFEEEGVTTTTVQIEKDGDTLALVPAAERGAPGLVVNGSKRSLIPFNTIHLPERATIAADQVQGIRAFGSMTELMGVQAIVNKRLAKMRNQIDATHEWHRIGAVKGQILDADGTTVLLDLYDRFKIQQTVFSLDLDKADTDMRLKCAELLDLIEDLLPGQTTTGVRVQCGRQLWMALLANKSIKETYLNTQMAASLRGDPREAIDFCGVVFERYRGKVGKTAYVGDDEGYAIPMGVPGLFQTKFGPADYMDTVNTMGLPYYAQQEPMDFKKGIMLEAQSNPLQICTRPGAIVKIKLKK
ncbi:major capsid protein [Chitinimonas lacunae]|uniref:Major capsid protein n=1 Tax=Chitinimonas lacunae TaxID=1963018 RepID=A0ABV8MN53_9NEIS